MGWEKKNSLTRIFKNVDIKDKMQDMWYVHMFFDMHAHKWRSLIPLEHVLDLAMHFQDTEYSTNDGMSSWD